MSTNTTTMDVTEQSTLQWLIPVLLVLFISFMLAIAVIICIRLRRAKQTHVEKPICTCSPKKSSKAKEFFKNSIFFTSTSSAEESPAYRSQCETNCLCDPQKCPNCRIDPDKAKAPARGILKSSR